MRPIFLSFIFSLAVLAAFCQEPSLKTAIVSTKTAAHQNASKTRIHLVPPAGFEPMSGFSGFQKAGKGVIIVVELQGENNFDKTAASFTKEGFAAKGMIMRQTQDLTVNGMKGKAIVATKGDDGTKSIILVFGDATFTALITTVYPGGEKETEADMIKSLESVWMNKDQKVDAFADAKFTLTQSASRFRYLNSVGNMHIYSLNGVDPAKVPNTPMVIISQVADAGIKASVLKAYARGVIESFREKQGTDFITNKDEEVTINGALAREIKETGKSEGKDVFVYNCVILGKGFSISVIGVAKRDIAETVKDFESFARAVKLK
ncbi:MAG: hypothetical protein ACTHMC_05575 [Pseudobacter sp.]|uniref:hypothetical protein n=1 Tax=Pseudobacter sp. TaxID=2045420 RepID=UPI003F818F42